MTKIWQKIKSKHSLLMVLYCLVPMILIISILSWFKGSNYFVWLIILLCPILHIWMMRWMMKRHRDDDSFCKNEVNQKSKYYKYKCPECGFEYKEKEWAEKCENWCKKYKSCNLEIIKHSIKLK